MSSVRVDLLKYPYCQKVLPLVYDDSLSYYENICKFVVKLNEMAEAINNIETDILEEAKEYTDSKVAETIEEINEKIAELNKLIAETKSDYETFTNVVNAKIVFINNRIDELNEYLEAGLVSANKYTDTAIEQNNEYIIKEIVEKGLINLKVLNYFTGEYVTVQEMFDYLAQFHLQNAITYEQFVAREKTYDEVAEYDASYTDLAINGFNIIV